MGVEGGGFDGSIVVVVGDIGEHGGDTVVVVGAGAEEGEVDYEEDEDSGSGGIGDRCQAEGLSCRRGLAVDEVGMLSGMSHDSVDHIDLAGAGLLRELL